jgi:hypothetical protein
VHAFLVRPQPLQPNAPELAARGQAPVRRLAGVHTLVGGELGALHRAVSEGAGEGTQWGGRGYMLVTCSGAGAPPPLREWCASLWTRTGSRGKKGWKAWTGVGGGGGGGVGWGVGASE